MRVSELRPNVLQYAGKAPQPAPARPKPPPVRSPIDFLVRLLLLLVTTSVLSAVWLTVVRRGFDRWASPSVFTVVVVACSAFCASLAVNAVWSRLHPRSRQVLRRSVVAVLLSGTLLALLLAGWSATGWSGQVGEVARVLLLALGVVGTLAVGIAAATQVR